MKYISYLKQPFLCESILKCDSLLQIFRNPSDVLSVSVDLGGGADGKRQCEDQ